MVSVYEVCIMHMHDGCVWCVCSHMPQCVKGKDNFQELALSLHCGFGLTQLSRVVQQAPVLSEPSQHPQ